MLQTAGPICARIISLIASATKSRHWTHSWKQFEFEPDEITI